MYNLQGSGTVVAISMQSVWLYHCMGDRWSGSFPRGLASPQTFPSDWKPLGWDHHIDIPSSKIGVYSNSCSPGCHGCVSKCCMLTRLLVTRVTLLSLATRTDRNLCKKTYKYGEVGHCPSPHSGCTTGSKFQQLTWASKLSLLSSVSPWCLSTPRPSGVTPVLMALGRRTPPAARSSLLQRTSRKTCKHPL
jgi:hypothetical protein